MRFPTFIIPLFLKQPMEAEWTENMNHTMRNYIPQKLSDFPTPHSWQKMVQWIKSRTVWLQSPFRVHPLPSKITSHSVSLKEIATISLWLLKTHHSSLFPYSVLALYMLENFVLLFPLLKLKGNLIFWQNAYLWPVTQDNWSLWSQFQVRR